MIDDYTADTHSCGYDGCTGQPGPDSVDHTLDDAYSAVLTALNRQYREKYGAFSKKPAWWRRLFRR